MFDYHVHSSFSTDCSVSMEQMVQQGIAIGLHEICFTDHIDYEYEGSRHGRLCFEFEPSEYFAEIQRLRNKYSSSIVIRSGVELGLQPHVLGECQRIVTANDFDFVLASVHNIEKNDLSNLELESHYTINQIWETYFEELLYAIENFPQFQVLGHFDLPRRYSANLAMHNLQNNYAIIETIFKTLISNGKGLEINSGGYYYGLNETNPSLALLKIYKNCGGEILTFGSDAHSLARLGEKYYETMQAIRQIGFKYICTCEKQQVKFNKLVGSG